jgi:hypothetical protein
VLAGWAEASLVIDASFGVSGGGRATLWSAVVTAGSEEMS